MGMLLPSRSLAVARMPSSFGHHDVHEDQVDLVLFHRQQGLLAVVGPQGLVALAGEIDVQRGNDVLVVVADQNGMHVSPSPFPKSF